MLRVPMLTRRGTTFYARVHVPLDLQPVLKKREVWKSLCTTSLPLGPATRSHDLPAGEAGAGSSDQARWRS